MYTFVLMLTTDHNPSNQDLLIITIALIKFPACSIVRRKEPHLQPHSTDCARNWFYATEKQFESARRSSVRDPRSSHIDVIETLSMKDRYNIFKTALINRFALSSRRQTHELLQGVKLNNCSPSELLRRMRKLADKDADSPQVLQLWTTAPSKYPRPGPPYGGVSHPSQLARGVWPERNSIKPR